MNEHASPSESSAAVDPDQLVLRHLPVVGHLVRETMARVPSCVDRDDLHSAGLVALVLAARAYDSERGVPFVRYATTRIRGALVDELRSVDWASRSVRRRSREIEEARSRLATEIGRLPGNTAVAAALGVSVDEVQQADSDVARASLLPLDAGPEGGSVADLLRSSAAGPEESLVLTERLEYLVDAIRELPERLRVVISGYFLEERPMVELAVTLGVSESRVSQLRAEALVLLRTALNSALDPHLVPVASRPGGAADRRRRAYSDTVQTRHSARHASGRQRAGVLEPTA